MVKGLLDVFKVCCKVRDNSHEEVRNSIRGILRNEIGSFLNLKIEVFIRIVGLGS